MSVKTIIWVVSVVLALLMSAQEAAAFDLDNCWIGYWGERESGVLQTYEFYIDVEGAGIANVRVVDQNNVTYNLAYDTEDDEWWYSDEYPTLAQVFTAHPNNLQYDFYYNEGLPDADNDTLTFNVTPPSTYPPVLYPGHGDTGIPVNPVYVWGSVAGVTNAVGLWMDVEEVIGPDDEDEIHWEWTSDLTRTTWHPGPLQPMRDYSFSVSTVNGGGSGYLGETTDLGDPYTYIADFGEGDSSDFTTGTGTVPALWLTVTASAQELGGATWDEFQLRFDCDNDIRLTHIAYNLATAAAGDLFFDVDPQDPYVGPGFDFTELPGSSPVGVTVYYSLDNSPLLGIECNDFQPGETLIFGIDVDRPDNAAFGPADFDNAWLGLVFDPSPAFPGADPFLVELYFDGTSAGVEVPEPATLALLVGGVMFAGFLRKRRPTTTCRRSK